MTLDHLRHDVRYALRQWRGAPGFALTALLTLALGIGGITAMFTLVDAVLRRPLPVHNPEELYRVGDNAFSGVVSGLQNNFGMFSYEQYKYFRDNTPEFAELAAFQADPRRVGVRRSGGAEPAQAAIAEFVSGNYFSLFGVAAEYGRVLIPRDDQPDSAPAAVLNHAAWRQKFGGDASIVGSTFLMNGAAVTVVGIAPEGFFGDSLRPTAPDFWVSILSERNINRASPFVDQPETLWLDVMGRIRPGGQPQQIESRLRVELQQWLTQRASKMNELDRGKIGRQTLNLVSGKAGVVSARSLRANYESGLRLLMLISGFVLLIVCANIANLALVRALERRRHASINVALGAGRWRLIGQALTESVLLALAGGLLGLGFAYAGTKAILRLVFAGTSDVPVSADPSVAVLVFAMGVSALTGILFGVVPAWISSRANPIDALRSGGRTTGASGQIPQKALVALQVALCLALLAASGLLLQSLQNLQAQSLGFAVPNRVAVRVDTFLAGYKPDQLEAFSRRTREELLRLPQVERVSESLYGPMSGSMWQGTVFVEGQAPPSPDSTENDCPFDRVGPGYFETVGTRLIDGREISERDVATSQHVVVVNESFARRFFGRENAVGRHFGKDGAKFSAEYEIVGVVEDAKYFKAEEPAPPMFFLPLTQRTNYSEDPAENTMETRSQYPTDFELALHRGTHVSEAEIRNSFANIDPNLPVVRVQSFEDEIGSTLRQQISIERLTLVFGLIALGLVCIGTYGVTSYAVQRRTREIGIRVALGADRAGILQLVALDASRLVGAGMAVGLPLALLAGNLVKNRLYGVGAYDPRILLGASLVLSIFAALATLLPAIRAARMSPVTALRLE